MIDKQALVLTLTCGTFFGILWFYIDRFTLVSVPFLLFLCFTTLGVLTSDFLLPSLTVLSKDLLRISDRVSGLTLLALGNALPDILSTYQSMSRGKTTLALGELLGAIFFVIAVIVPVAILMQNDKQQININKVDSLVFMIMVSTVLGFLSNGNLGFNECMVLVTAYVLYVIYATIWVTEKKDILTENEVQPVPRMSLYDALEFEEEEIQPLLHSVVPIWSFAASPGTPRTTEIQIHKTLPPEQIKESSKIWCLRVMSVPSLTFCKLIIIQSSGPVYPVLFLPLLVWIDMFQQMSITQALVLLAFGAVLCIISSYIEPKYVSILTFVSSLVIISLFVKLVVDFLLILSHHLNVPHSIIGLTVFAWGNSMGDLISNIILIKLGMPDLVLGACIGSPLMYFVFGIGVNGILLRDKQTIFEVEEILVSTSIGLMSCFIVYAIGIPLYGLHKYLSGLCLFIYTSITLWNIMSVIS